MLRPARWTAAALLLAPAVAQAPTAPRAEPRGVLPADWDARDLEGKWVAYRHAIDLAKGETAPRHVWMVALGSRRELELLEWIVIFDRSHEALAELARVEAPQLLRAATWALAGSDSRGRDAATKVLSARGPRVLAWLDANRTVDGPAVRALRQQLGAANVGAKADANDLPALDPVQVLVPWLDAPARLERFGDRTTAAPKVRYVHQVLRALSGVQASGGTDDFVVAKVSRLTAHADPEVSDAAFDTLSRLPPENVPFEPMLRIVDDGKAAAARRELAAEVLSFSSHPRVQPELARVALDVGHPARDIAFARLGEVGDPVGILPLRTAAATLPRAEAGKLFLVFAAVDRRVREHGYVRPRPARALLLRVAWLRANGDPRAAEALDATTDLWRTWSRSRGVAGVVLNVVDGPAAPSPFRGDEAARVERELAALIHELTRRPGDDVR